MRKEKLVYLFGFVLLLSLMGFYVLGAALNDPGHMWSEMDCDNKMCVATDTVSIGSTTPDTSKLYVNGVLTMDSIVDRNNTAFTVDPAGTGRFYGLNLGDSLSSYSSFLKIQNATDGYDSFYINTTAAGRSGIYSLASSAGATSFAATFSGGTAGVPLRLLTLPGGSGYTALLIDTASGIVYRNTSSLKYKTNIQPLNDNFYKILNLQPKSFINKSTGTKDIGYIAEELDKLGLKNLVIYENGEPESIQYDKVSIYLLEILKDQEKRINELEKEVQDLGGK